MVLKRIRKVVKRTPNPDENSAIQVTFWLDKYERDPTYKLVMLNIVNDLHARFPEKDFELSFAHSEWDSYYTVKPGFEKVRELIDEIPERLMMLSKEDE